VFDPVRPDSAGRLALGELETVVRHVTEQLAVFRRRALAAESRLRDADGTLGALKEAVERARRESEGAAELRRALAAAQRDAARIADVERALATARQEAGRIAELERALAEARGTAGRVAELEAALADAQRAATDGAAEVAAHVADGRGEALSKGTDAHQLAAENAALRERLHEAVERTRLIAERVRFLRQQLANGAEK
jgi:hypothetical protein